jgi:glycosyltransferase involved in cell wall biosynthesis
VKVPIDEITVVVPTFNRLNLLKRALESVLQETRVPLRVHVFDNASTDGSDTYLNELAAMDKRVVFERNNTNIGAQENYIKALSSVQSEYFVPLADDDYLLPNFLFKAYNLSKDYPEAGAIVFCGQAIDQLGKSHHTYPSIISAQLAGYLSPEAHLRMWMLYGHYLWSAVLWKKACRDHVGYPYFHTGLPSDVDFQVQVFSAFPVIFSPDFGAVYLKHSAQESNNYSMKQIPDWANFINRMDEVVSPLFDAEEYKSLRAKVLRRYQASWASSRGFDCQRNELGRFAFLSASVLDDLNTASKIVELLQVNELYEIRGGLISSLIAAMNTQKEVNADHQRNALKNEQERADLRLLLSTLQEKKGWKEKLFSALRPTRTRVAKKFSKTDSDLYCQLPSLCALGARLRQLNKVRKERRKK